MKIRVLILCLLAALLLAAVPAVSAEDTYILQCDFEKYSLGDFEDASAFYAAHKQGRILVEELDGSKVLAFRHSALEKSEDCYLDLCTHAQFPQLGPVYCISYDFRYESAPEDAAWQILCSRQTPASGTQFQQVGYVRSGGTLTVTNNSYTKTLEANRWYRLTAVVDEEANLFDLYINSVPVASGVPFTISDQTATYPERLRIGMGNSTSEYTMFVDNIEVYNGAIPHDVRTADLSVVERTLAVADVVPPTYTRTVSVSRPVWYALGTAASLLLAASGIFLLRRIKKQKES